MRLRQKARIIRLKKKAKAKQADASFINKIWAKPAVYKKAEKLRMQAEKLEKKARKIEKKYEKKI